MGHERYTAVPCIPVYTYGVLIVLSVCLMGTFIWLGIEHPIVFQEGVAVLGFFGLLMIHLATSLITDQKGQTICGFLGFLASVISLILVLGN